MQFMSKLKKKNKEYKYTIPNYVNKYNLLQYMMVLRASRQYLNKVYTEKKATVQQHRWVPILGRRKEKTLLAPWKQSGGAL